MKKVISFTPAFDKRSDDPKKNYGVGCMRIWFRLIGPKGATQFAMSTGIHLDHIREEFKGKAYVSDPMGVDVGYHAYEPQYKGQHKMEECDVLPGAEDGCYYDGSSLQAEELMEKFLEEGEDAVWSRLEEVYKYRFENPGETEEEDMDNLCVGDMISMITKRGEEDD